ncbi:MAG: carbohydrate ABC transporter permease [Lentisphaeria bacterium]|nr:carbohydrate ABC transporter permease [Lentisphaeria bacterium]
MRKRTFRHLLPLCLRHAVLLAFLAVTAYPLLWMAMTAFRAEGDAQARPLGLPRPWVLDNLAEVVRNGDFGGAYVNSLLLCTVSVVLAVCLSALAAFAFAQLRFRGSHALFLLFLVGMMIPVHVTLIPLNRLLGAGGLGIKGGLAALAGPYIGFALPISILILRGAFAALPADLLDASRVDGCSAWGVFRHVALPLSRPALATVIIFNFLTMWNEFAFALTLLGPGCETLPLALTQFKGEHDIQITLTSAALVLVVIPLVVVYVFAQKHIIRGLTAGAVKE